VSRAHGHQPLADVGACAHTHAQSLARILVHEAPFGAREQAAARFGEAMDIDGAGRCRLVDDRARVGREAACEAIQQGRLARPRFADDAQNFARPQIEVHIVAGDATAEALGDVADREERG
jgi:hypothetical protein